MPAPQLSNYVLETATAPGTGSFTLNGPEADRRSFEAAFSSGALVFYFADDGSSAEWGIGTLTVGTPSVLARTTVLGNTANTKTALNFPGTVEVYNEIPAEFMPVLGQDGSLDLAGALTVQGRPAVVGFGSGNSNYILQITYDTGAQAFGYLDGTGVWRYAQPKGDYATNSALSAEVARATTIESNLQGSKVSLYGDTMKGPLSVQDAAGVSAAFDPGGQTSGAFVNYAPVQSIALGRGGSFGLYVQEHVGSAFNGVLSVSYPGGSYRAVSIPQNARMMDSLYGEVAYTNDFASYVSKTAYANDFASSDSRVTNLAYSQREVGFNVMITSNGQYVPFPNGFAKTPDCVLVSDAGNDAGKTDAWPISAPAEKWTANGCTIYIGSAAVPRRVAIIAKGSR
ncbi:hypothetical protein [Acetobacter sp. KSO5]|uniref:hypothetical protein n=1 Tax=Acetobacter sp. KSO5 TaxID=3373674 RepID=UPI00376F21D1